MEFNIQRLLLENHLRAYFTTSVEWLGGLDFDQGVSEYCVTETKSRSIKRKQKELPLLMNVNDNEDSNNININDNEDSNNRQGAVY